MNVNAQKRVHFSKIEIQKNGLYYQINTIDAFTGTAYEVHPPKNEKEKEKAKNEYEAFLKTARKREEVDFVNGKTHGKARGWDEYGKKTYEAEFVEGMQEGLERQWFPTGAFLEIPKIEDGTQIQFFSEDRHQDLLKLNKNKKRVPQHIPN